MDKNSDKKEGLFRPRSNIAAGIHLHRFLDEAVKSLVKNGLKACKENSDKYFSENPNFLNITVKEFFDAPTVTDVLLEYIKVYDLDKSVASYRPNKGFDFPEDYENKGLLRVVKDFSLYAINCIIPENTPSTLHISYAQIVRGAMLKMSCKEFMVIIKEFKKTEPLYKREEVCAKLSIVALFVIFDRYIKDKQEKTK